MRIFTFIFGITVLAFAPVLAQVENSNAEVLQVVRELNDLLSTVKDKASAEASLTKLKTLDVKFSALIKNPRPKFSEDEEKLFTESKQEFHTQLTRLEILPTVRPLF